MKLKNTFYLLFIFVYTLNKLTAQEKFLNNEISISSDNDAYLFANQDQYYTNGINLNYFFCLSKSIENQKPKIVSISLNHQIHTGRRYLYDNKVFWDSPTLGYLSLTGSLTKVITNNSFIKYDIELAQIGPKAQGKQMQKILHNVFKMYNVKGWEHELPNKFGMNLGFTYQRELFKGFSNKFEISGISQSTLGTLTANTNLGVVLRLGKFKNINSSVYNKANLASQETNNEFYIAYEPKICYQLGNFTNGDSYVYESNIKRTNNIEPFYFKHSLGITYAKKRTTLKFSLIQYTQQIKQLDRKLHQYGQLSFGYRF